MSIAAQLPAAAGKGTPFGVETGHEPDIGAWLLNP